MHSRVPHVLLCRHKPGVAAQFWDIAVFMGGGPGGKKVEALDVYHPHITAFFCTVVAAVAATAAAQVHKLCKGH